MRALDIDRARPWMFTVAPLSVSDAGRLDGDRDALDASRVVPASTSIVCAFFLSMPVISCVWLPLIVVFSSCVISMTMFWSDLISKSFFECMVDLLVGHDAERAVSILQQLRARLVLAVEGRAEDDRAARVAVLEADHDLLVDLREHQHAARVAAAHRGDGRPRRLLGVGQARVLHAHATALLGVVVVGHHADHEPTRPSRGSRAGGSARSACGRERPEIWKLRLVAGGAAVVVRARGLIVNSPPNLVPTPSTLTFEPALIAGLPMRGAVGLEVGVRHPLQRRLGDRVGLARCWSPTRSLTAVVPPPRSLATCAALRRRPSRSSAGCSRVPLTTFLAFGSQPRTSTLSTCWMPLMRGRKVVSVSPQRQRRSRRPRPCWPCGS